VRERIERTREGLWLLEMASTVLPETVQQRIKSRMRSNARPTPRQDELPVQPLTPELIRFLRARTRVRIDKARRLLGYRPAFDFAAGMDLTEQWARWANLL
jgi:nucleoside-diphosphate-sugar epimerase